MNYKNMYPTLVPYDKENSFFAKNYVPSFARYVWYVARIRNDVCRAWREKTINDSYCSCLCSNRLLVCILLKVLYGRPKIPRYHRTQTLNIPTTNNIMTMDNNNYNSSMQSMHWWIIKTCTPHLYPMIRRIVFLPKIMCQALLGMYGM